MKKISVPDMQYSSIASKIIIPLMGLIVLFILGNSITQSLAPSGSTDFHSYWYYGHFVRQGDDPYLAYFSQTTPTVPVQYLDNIRTDTLPIAKPGLAHTPANTAPIVLLLSLFSWVSWESAKTIWMIINLTITLLIPWLVIHLLPDQKTFSFFQISLIFFSFFILQGTRIANWVGQTTILVFALMLGSLLLARKNRVLAGLMLGVALSKYSLAMAVFLFLCFKREYHLLIISIITQLGATLLISLLGNHSPLLTFNHYFKMIVHHTFLPGIHIGSLFAPESKWALILVALVSIVFFIQLWLNRTSFWDNHLARNGRLTFNEWHIFSSFILWSLLVVYHRAYDTLTVIIFITLMSYGLNQMAGWTISSGKKQVLLFFYFFFLAVMSIPASVMGIILPAHIMPVWYQVISNVTTVTLLTAFSVNLWLLHRLPLNYPVEY